MGESLPAEQVIVTLLERQRRRVVSGGDGVGVGTDREVVSPEGTIRRP